MPDHIVSLLDTNIFVRLIRNDAVGQSLKHNQQLLLTDATPAYCSVTEGEIRSLALQFNWGTGRIEQLHYLLEYFRAVSIKTEEVMHAYAVIDAYSKSQGIVMGKNDVWIAAVAYTTGFDLLTTDRDFDHLHDKFLNRKLIATTE